MSALILRGLVGALLQPGFISLFLFAPTVILQGGSLVWPRAWLLLGAYTALLIPTVFWLAWSAPKSLAARLRKPRIGRQPLADRIVTALIIVFFSGWLVFLATDVHHLQLLPKPSPILSGIGGLIFLIGYGLITVAIRQNPYSVQFVEDQTDQGQTVIDTGLYRHLRHPLYLGVQLFTTGVGLWLESWPATISSLGMTALLMARLTIEERLLRTILPGYIPYTYRVPHRMFPRIW